MLSLSSLPKEIEMAEPSDLVLSPEEIYAIAHCEMPDKQMATLRAMGIPAHLRGADHSVCVLRVHVISPVGPAAQAEPERPRKSLSELDAPMSPFVHLRWILLPLFCSLTGYTEKAVRRKIEEGFWLEGRHYRKAPDGRITMDLQAYYAWVEGRDH